MRLWTAGESSNRTTGGMVDALITQATEVRSIARLYAGLLGRLPEDLTTSPERADGLTYWTGVLRSFRSKYAGIPYREALTYLVEEWLREPELAARFPARDTPQYVTQLCRAVLNRVPSAGEATSWINIAENPERGRARLAVALSESAEYKSLMNGLINEKLRDQAAKPLEPLPVTGVRQA